MVEFLLGTHKDPGIEIPAPHKQSVLVQTQHSGHERRRIRSSRTAYAIYLLSDLCGLQEDPVSTVVIIIVIIYTKRRVPQYSPYHEQGTGFRPQYHTHTDTNQPFCPQVYHKALNISCICIQMVSNMNQQRLTIHSQKSISWFCWLKDTKISNQK